MKQLSQQIDLEYVEVSKIRVIKVLCGNKLHWLGVGFSSRRINNLILVTDR